MRIAKLAFLLLPSLAVGPVDEVVGEPVFEPVRVMLDGKSAPPASWSVCGFSLVADRAGPQLAFTRDPASVLASLQPGETASLAITFRQFSGPFSVSVQADLVAGSQVEVGLSLGDESPSRQRVHGDAVTLSATGVAEVGGTTIHLKTWSDGEVAAVRWRNVELKVGRESFEVPLAVDGVDTTRGAPPELPALRPAIEASLIEWDWRMQDGIDTRRAPSDYKTAVRKTLDRGDRLVADLEAQGVTLGNAAMRWKKLRSQWQQLQAATSPDQATWEVLWRNVHRLRREIALLNPLAQTGPIALVKRVPSCFSHQITQYYGSCAKPGGGVFVLEQPGQSMRCRQLAAGALPVGSVEHLDVSRDGQRILFAFCRADTIPKDRTEHLDRFYHLYEVAADGTGLRQLTDGPFDDFAPRYLPNGKIAFVSTRRGGFHRCGRGPCPVYTLTLANADGSDIRTISFHETHEWDPAVLNDGRLIYTRWDYVDRNAVHYQQLWTVRPDGTDVRIFFGNNTFNPVGIWEASAVPGSNRVMATAAAHHAMTAGSIILLDVNQGVDGMGSITRLTPDAPFPESETPLYQSEKGAWHAAKGAPHTPPTPIESQRWPGHCYRTPFPLSETYFLAAYSFDRLIGEPTYNRANMFGLYLVDAFGNKELLYRDLNISSLWPVPLAPRPAAPDLPSVRNLAGDAHGFFLLQDVYRSWPKLPDGSVERLRIVQVLPKSTPHINQPRVGAANASPGKQVLGTVPVEADGSAYFRAPAGVPLAFQALDAQGQAVQIMRSLTYLQPGETVACVGCHEHRQSAPAVRGFGDAFAKPPADIEPGPEGSRPLSYPRLVQPLLDRHCVACHNREKPGGDVVLTGEPEGPFTKSYNALIGLVSYPAWGNGDNSEPLSRPDYFGARGSRLTTLLRDGHYAVTLPPDDWERLITWMDANALFYGTFDVEDQKRQRRGERIRGPAIE